MRSLALCALATASPVGKVIQLLAELKSEVRFCCDEFQTVCRDWAQMSGDGHTQFVNEDIDYAVYALLMTPDSKNSSINQPWKSRILGANDYASP